MSARPLYPRCRLFFLLPVLFAVGCRLLAQDAATTTPTISGQPFPGSEPTPTLTLLPTLSPPETEQPIPSKVPSMTDTARPTLTTSERIAFTRELFEPKPGCQLPCWWGFTPGTSMWSEVEQFILQSNIHYGTTNYDDNNYHGSGGLDLEVDHHFINIDVDFKEEKGIIEGIGVRVDGFGDPKIFEDVWRSYSPANIVMTYGRPSRVKMATLGYAYGPRHGYDLWLIYDNFGFIIHYMGFLDTIDSVYYVCPRFENGKDINYIDLYIQRPNSSEPLEDLGGIASTSVLQSSKPIEEVANISMEEFYQLFTEKEIPCFTTPQDAWK